MNRIRNRWQSGLVGKLLIIVLLFVICSCALIVGASFLPEPAPTTPTPKPTATAIPPTPTPQEVLRDTLLDELGTISRDADRVWNIGPVSNGTLTIKWGMRSATRPMAGDEILTILQGVRGSGIEYEELQLLGTASLVDQLGNASEQQVLTARYSRDTIDKINFENMLIDNVYLIADDMHLAPVFDR